MNAEERREYIRRLVADCPPLTTEQRIRLAILLRPEPSAAQTADVVTADGD